ncbi:hypothetical protein Taro_024528 [Colocasia esculenta]|uniref:Dynein light chain n=1 Tax=Colocasia esculenta TaxID=4460 RepID=A0A843V0K6_COLES|nr:hypothetical protein [Colocasia esculenta]
MVMARVEEKGEMEGATAELDPRRRHLSCLIQQQRRKNNVHSKAAEEERRKGGSEEAKAATKQVVVVVQGRKEAALARVELVPEPSKGLGLSGGCRSGGAMLREQPRLVRVRAADMAPELRKRAFWCAGEVLAGMGRLDSKRLALALKKSLDTQYSEHSDVSLGSSLNYVIHGLLKRTVAKIGYGHSHLIQIGSVELAVSKNEFDSSYGPAWHCIVGTNFGSYITHSVGGFLYFSIDKVYILIFKTAVQPFGQ